ncbi:site-2 protease family protein [Oceanithermus sp.]
MGLLAYLSQPLVFLVAFAASTFGLVVHNLVQAWLADRYGDTLPRRMGFLTVDAKTHLDPLGVLFLVLFGFGWPRSVPFRLNGKKGLIVALSGPVGFLLAGFVYLLLASILPRGYGLDQIAYGLQVAASVMVIEAAVFLFPVPPLDGARAVYAAGSYESRRMMDRIASYGTIGFIVIFLVLSYTGVLGAVQAGLMGFLHTLLRLLGL